MNKTSSRASRMTEFIVVAGVAAIVSWIVNKLNSNGFAHFLFRLVDRAGNNGHELHQLPFWRPPMALRRWAMDNYISEQSRRGRFCRGPNCHRRRRQQQQQRQPGQQRCSGRGRTLNQRAASSRTQAGLSLDHTRERVHIPQIQGSDGGVINSHPSCPRDQTSPMAGRNDGGDRTQLHYAASPASTNGGNRTKRPHSTGHSDISRSSSVNRD